MYFTSVQFIQTQDKSQLQFCVKSHYKNLFPSVVVIENLKLFKTF